MLSSRRYASDSRFLNEVEQSVANVLHKHGTSSDITLLPPEERESVGVARNLDSRLKALARNNDCRRCWLQRAHCVCDKCPSLEEGGPVLKPKVKRLFLLMHHKEICLAVDTAKFILAGLPETSRLVVGGLASPYQDSMREMEEAIKGDKCLVLFPTEEARTFDEIEQNGNLESAEGWDIIVIDGTWAQARKLHSRYVSNVKHVELSDEAVNVLAQASGGENVGHQLRRHPIKWREVSTLEATRLFCNDMVNSNDVAHPWDALASYQKNGDAAARTQLGPPRTSR